MSHQEHKKPVVLVSGATGAQGGSIIKYLLQDGGFSVRGFTRDGKSSKAQALEKQGVSIAQGDLKDKKSLDAALVGVDYFFLVTQFWEKCTEEEDYQQGAIAVSSIKDAKSLKHVVFSALPGAFIHTGNKLQVPHFDSKWRAAMLLQSLGISYTLVFASYYNENWASWFKPNTSADGKTTMGVPMEGKRFGQGSIGDIGLVTLPAFKNPHAFNGKIIDFATEQLNVTECVANYNRANGTHVAPLEVPYKVFAKFGFPGAEELAIMFAYFQVIADSRAANPSNPYAALGVRAADYILADKRAFPALQSQEDFFRHHRAPASSAPSH